MEEDREFVFSSESERDEVVAQLDHLLLDSESPKESDLEDSEHEFNADSDKIAFEQSNEFRRLLIEYENLTKGPLELIKAEHATQISNARKNLSSFVDACFLSNIPGLKEELEDKKSENECSALIDAKKMRMLINDYWVLRYFV